MSRFTLPPPRRPLAALLLVTALLIWAGLQPFDFARCNGVSDTGHGVRFTAFGLAVSETMLDWTSTDAPAPMTLEIWLTPDVTTPGDRQPRAWLVLMDGTRLTPFGMRQEGADLVIWDAVTNPPGDRWYNDRRVADALVAGQPLYVAVTSGGAAPPQVYLDGRAVAAEGGFTIPFARAGEPFGGTLVVGSGPPWETAWSGNVHALVLWSRVLSTEEIAARAVHHESNAELLGASPVGIVAAYRLHGEQGERIADLSGRGNDLQLPEFFRPPNRILLAPLDLSAWKEPWFAIDVLLNVAGFVVFGYLLVSVLGRRRHTVSPGVVLLAIAAGFGLSLLFEYAQMYMVTRSSTVQDLVLNSVGVFAGAVIGWRKR